MNIDYEVQVELPIGNGDYDDITYEDINVSFECELIGAQSGVGIDREYLEVVGFDLPEEYRGNKDVESQVDSCLEWVSDKLNEEL